jgi:GT2 family glycosyltransferase
MVKKELVDKIGGLDERFGLGGQDDADYCIRAREAGYQVGICRDVFIYHYGSATFRNEFGNDVPKSSEYAKSRIELLRDKHRDRFDTGVKKRVMVCIPNGGNIVTELATLLIRWTHDERWILNIYMPKGMFPLDNARNHCVQKFLEGNADYLLWIDDDIVPPPDTIERFLKADKDIIGAAAFAMKYENEMGFPYPVTLRYNEDKKYIVYYGEGIEKVDATGGACVMFKRKVYEAIERPYAFQYYRNGTLALTCDFDVFQKTEKLGFELWIDFGLICDHVRTASLKSIQNTLAREMK